MWRLRVVQDPAEAEGRVMPQAAISSVAIDKILSLAEIGPFLVGFVRQSKESKYERTTRSTSYLSMITSRISSRWKRC